MCLFYFFVTCSFKSIDSVRNTFQAADSFNEQNQFYNGTKNGTHVNQPAPRYTFLDHGKKQQANVILNNIDNLKSAAFTQSTNNANFLFNSLNQTAPTANQHEQLHQQDAYFSQSKDFISKSNTKLHTGFCPIIKNETTENVAMYGSKTGSKLDELVNELENTNKHLVAQSIN